MSIPASFENKRRPSESGRPLCACSNASTLFSGSHFFLLDLIKRAAKGFLPTFFATMVLRSPPVCSCLGYRVRGKPTCSDWAAKRESKRFRYFLTSPHLTLLPPLFSLPAALPGFFFFPFLPSL